LQELTQREVEYISLSRDTTEADLKQRREIINGTAHYIDQVSTVYNLAKIDRFWYKFCLVYSFTSKGVLFGCNEVEMCF